MTSTLGSARDDPAHGHVKFVPSMRKAFSFTPDPNEDTMFTAPLDGDVGDMPGALRIASNMLNRRVGIIVRWSGPNRVSSPLERASMLEPAVTVTDWATLASFSDHPALERRAGANADAFFPIRRKARRHLDDQDVHARGQHREPPLTLLVRDGALVSPICAGEATMTVAPARWPPCSSFTDPLSEPDNPCPSAVPGRRREEGERDSKPAAHDVHRSSPFTRVRDERLIP